MEIKAKWNADYKSVEALIHLNLYKKQNPKKAILVRTLITLFTVTICFVNVILFGIETHSVVLFISVLILGFIEYYMHYILPKIRYRALGKMSDVKNEYVFMDECMICKSIGEQYSGSCEIKYENLMQVYSTEKYYFITQTKTQFFIVDKETIENGSSMQIQEKLHAVLKEKFIICKY